MIFSDCATIINITSMNNLNNEIVIPMKIAICNYVKGKRDRLWCMIRGRVSPSDHSLGFLYSFLYNGTRLNACQNINMFYHDLREELFHSHLKSFTSMDLYTLSLFHSVATKVMYQSIDNVNWIMMRMVIQSIISSRKVISVQKETSKYNSSVTASSV